jgi:hypothetical protein
LLNELPNVFCAKSWSNFGAHLKTARGILLLVDTIKATGEVMAESHRQERDLGPEKEAAAVPYTASGHPPVEQLMAKQGTGPITDVSVLRGNFWPEEESMEEFLATIREWRCHKRVDRSA